MGLLLAAVLGILPSLVVLAILGSLADSTTHVLVTTPIELGGLLSALVLAIAIVFLVGRDSAGHLALALTLTPRRGRLHLSRATSFALAGAVVSGSAAIVTAVAAVAVARGNSVGWAALGVMLIASASACLALVAFGIATLIRRAGPAVLVLIGVLIVLPLVLALVGGALPAGMSALAETTANATPTALFMRAIAVSTVPTQGLAGVLAGQAGLAAWAGLSAVVSGYTFSRRDA